MFLASHKRKSKAYSQWWLIGRGKGEFHDSQCFLPTDDKCMIYKGLLTFLAYHVTEYSLSSFMKKTENFERTARRKDKDLLLLKKKL